MTHDDRPPWRTAEPGGNAPAEDMSCEEAARNVFEYLDGELATDYSDRIRGHIEICRRCHPYFSFEQAFLDYVHDRGLKPARSQELDRKLRRLLEEIDASET